MERPEHVSVSNRIGAAGNDARYKLRNYHGKFVNQTNFNIVLSVQCLLVPGLHLAANRVPLPHR